MLLLLGKKVARAKGLVKGSMIKEKDLEPKFLDWKDWWQQSARKRFEKLKKTKRIQTDVLFTEKIDELDIDGWLGAVGVR